MVCATATLLVREPGRPRAGCSNASTNTALHPTSLVAAPEYDNLGGYPCNCDPRPAPHGEVIAVRLGKHLSGGSAD